MQAVKSAYIFAVRTGFATEAGRISCVFYRKIFLVENYIAVNIGYRYFSCRNQIQIVYLTVVHLTFFVGQLSCAISRSCIYHIRRLNFEITCVAGIVEEKIDQSALQACAFSFVNRKASARDFYTKLKINQIVFFCQIPVRHSAIVKFWNFASFTLNHIVFGVFSGRNRIVWQVGNLHQKFI